MPQTELTRRPIAVFVTRALPAPVEQRLSALFEARLSAAQTPLSPAALLAGALDADALAPTIGDRLDADFFARCGDRLKLVANYGAGVDHIDVEAAHARGIVVTNTPSVLTDDAADMAMALILAVPRRLAEGVKALEEGRFLGWSPTWMLGRRVRGKKLGVIGMGRVGQAIAQRARAFGLSIHYNSRGRINPHLEEELGATYWPSLDDMLAAVDIVSVNCPSTPATRHLLSRPRLERLRPDAYVVNVARGDIIDEEALADLIAEERIAGAGLDVFEHAPRPHPKLIASPHVVLLPHMASATMESRVEMGEMVIINIKMFADGHTPVNRVIPDLG